MSTDSTEPQKMMASPQSFKGTWWGEIYETFKPYGLGTIALVVLFYWFSPYADRIITGLIEDREKSAEVIKLQATTLEKSQETQEQLQKTVEAISRTIETQAENGKTLSESNVGIKNVLETVTTQQKKHTDLLESIDKNTKPQ